MSTPSSPDSVAPTSSDASGSSPRVAVVTGAARGIGLAIARWFLAQGHDVALLDVDAPTLHAACKSLQADHRSLPQRLRFIAVEVDVSQEDQVQRPHDAVMAQWGHVDALVNNAGVASFSPALQTPFAEWRRIMATNLDGVFLCSQAFGRTMVDQGKGAVVNIASISGMRASLLRVAYGTSKAAVMHLTRQHAAEWGALGVRVNAICPGPVETAMAKQVHSAAIRRDYHDAIPLGRYGSEEEMAQTVGFLCSDQASYINGQCLGVDGGFDAIGIGLPTFRNDMGL